MTTTATPLTVELPVCPHPDCQHVGKLPVGPPFKAAA